jgi:intracellular sulfur oxidation DsrE/DsrF family protein
MTKHVKGRRQMMAGLGVTATAVALGTAAVEAQAPAGTFAPARHESDEWMGKMPGKHRVVIDVTSPGGIPDGIRFTGNLFTGNKTGYGVDEADVAIIMVLRHSATAYGYTDAIWSKYGTAMAGSDAAAAPPSTNRFNTGDRMQFADLAKRGVRFMVCGTASRGMSRRIAGQTGDADAIFKEMEANLIPSARVVAAGVVGMTHAQEYGFSLLFVG